MRVGWMRTMVSSNRSPKALPPAGITAAVPRTSIMRGCHGGSTSSITMLARPVRCTSRSFLVWLIRRPPDAYAGRLAGATGRERHPDLAWTTAAYVSHVTDNLRTWVERLAGGYLAGDLEVPGYDPDLLSPARHYNEVSLAGAL